MGQQLDKCGRQGHVMSDALLQGCGYEAHMNLD